ncbi:MAG TPA: helix-turn-helix domain-containing protein [Gemmatimonadales bacterium]|nr:helix-turn-helix domain-containing protein [Gemmatimonadales bacterium]
MTPLHILVVSADSTRRDELAGLLGATHRPVAVADAGAALEQLETGTDVVVLDLALPELDLAKLREVFSPGEEGEPDSLDAAERRHLSLVLRHTAGNKRKAALILGISRSTLLNKVRKYGLGGR